MGYEYYDYGYNAGSAVATGLGAALGILAFFWIICIAVGVFSIVCMWKVFKKAGKNGWEALIPIYNLIVMLEITELPMWYIALFLIPVGNVVAMFLIYIELAKKFGQSTGFGIGLVFLNIIFMAMLAFNKKYVYQGNMAMNNGQVYNNQPNYNSQMNNQPMYNNQPNYNSQMMNNQPMYNNQPNMNEPVQSTMNNQVVEPVIAPVNPVVEPVNPVVNEPVTEQVNQVPVQPVQSSNCSRCGSQVNPGDKFCMYCGNQL